MNLTIYSLQLEEGKYYIGKTNCFEDFDGCEHCFQKHQSGKGSEWTKLYKPIQIIDKYKSNSHLDVDILTKKYMIKYGIQNVRGGSFTEIELDENIIKELECELKKKSLLKYLCIFETEEEIDKEITRLENVVIEINELFKNIVHYKYIQITNDKNEQMKIEIEPSIINTYHMRNLDSTNSKILYSGLLRYKGDGNKPNIIRDENIVHNIYKVYIYRRRLEEQYLEIYVNENIGNNSKFGDVNELINIINEKIELLYEKLYNYYYKTNDIYNF